MINKELLSILRCPKTKSKLELIELNDKVIAALEEKYKQYFPDTNVSVKYGLLSKEARLIYPIVQDIPILLEEEALSQTVLDEK